MIRCHIYGFKIKNIRLLEGSKNQYSLQKVLNELYDGDDPEIDEYLEARKIAQLFFNENSIAAGFKNETDDHWYFLRALIHIQNDIVYTGFEYSAPYFFEYLERLKPKVKNEVKQIIDYFINGRSIFSEKSALSPAYVPYVVISLQEIETIIKDFDENTQIYQDENEIYKEFIESLKKIAEKQSDLFFLAS